MHTDFGQALIFISVVTLFVVGYLPLLCWVLSHPIKRSA